MKAQRAITVRNLPAHVERFVRRRAQADGVSLNKAIIALLEESITGKRRGNRKILFDDLDHLAGRWSKRGADSFDAALRSQRTIDADLWR